MNLDTVLLLAALIVFIIAALGVSAGRVNLIAAGLALVTASMLF